MHRVCTGSDTHHTARSCSCVHSFLFCFWSHNMKLNEVINVFNLLKVILGRDKRCNSCKIHKVVAENLTRRSSIGTKPDVLFLLSSYFLLLTGSNDGRCCNRKSNYSTVITPQLLPVAARAHGTCTSPHDRFQRLVSQIKFPEGCRIILCTSLQLGQQRSLLLHGSKDENMKRS